MPVTDLASLPRTGVLIGIDPGSRSLTRLFEIYDARKAVALIIGLPLNMDESEGRRAQSARALAWNILLKRDVPIVFQDERLSSEEAESVMQEASMSAKRRAEMIDATAAAIILKSALDRLERLG